MASSIPCRSSLVDHGVAKPDRVKSISRSACSAVVCSRSHAPALMSANTSSPHTSDPMAPASRALSADTCHAQAVSVQRRPRIGRSPHQYFRQSAIGGRVLHDCTYPRPQRRTDVGT
jgi:hypothetical protein